MYFLIGNKNGQLKYTFQFKKQEQADKAKAAFKKAGVELTQVTAAQFAEAKRVIERRIWG